MAEIGPLKETDMNFAMYLINLLKQPSTYAGFASLAAALGLHFSAVQLNSISTFLMSVGGLLAVFISESGSPPPPPPAAH